VRRRSEPSKPRDAFMARLSAPRGSNSVAERETRQTGLAQVLTPTGDREFESLPPSAESRASPTTPEAGQASRCGQLVICPVFVALRSAKTRLHGFSLISGFCVRSLA
jgi:hypothetical protein